MIIDSGMFFINPEGMAYSTRWLNNKQGQISYSALVIT